MKHGTHSAYVQGCHCELCTEAKRKYIREWRNDETMRLQDAEPYRKIALGVLERTGEPMSTVAAWCHVDAGTFRNIVNGKQTVIRFRTAVKLKGLEAE